jgi:hypothetical protein
MEIKFYPNTPDDLHCVEACFQMVLKYLFPDQDWSLEQLRKMVRHLPHKGAALSGMMIELVKLGLHVVNIENLDYGKFAEDGEDYLKTIWDSQTLAGQKELIDIRHEQKLAKELTQSDKVELVTREAVFKDAENYFHKNNIVLVSINPLVLDGREGYWSHLVVITDINNDSVTFHDPGLPPQPNRVVSKKVFIESMTPPRKPDTNVVAIGKN